MGSPGWERQWRHKVTSGAGVGEKGTVTFSFDDSALKSQARSLHPYRSLSENSVLSDFRPHQCSWAMVHSSETHRILPSNPEGFVFCAIFDSRGADRDRFSDSNRLTRPCFTPEPLVSRTPDTPLPEPTPE